VILPLKTITFVLKKKGTKIMEKNKEKIVGILGGMGPFATLEFFRQILLNTPAKKDWEHFHIIIDNNTKIPSRTRALLYNETSPAPMMIESINRLADNGADFVVIPCNQAHFWYEEIQPKIKIPWLNMISVTADVIKKRRKKKPLILGGWVTIEKKLYSRFIPQSQYLTNDLNKIVYQVIEEIKLTMNLSPQLKKKFLDAIDSVKKDIDSIILACTELPIIFTSGDVCGIETINANTEYIQALIRYAKGAKAE